MYSRDQTEQGARSVVAAEPTVQAISREGISALGYCLGRNSVEYVFSCGPGASKDYTRFKQGPDWENVIHEDTL